MDLILEQVAALNTKVDALYRMVNQMNQTVGSLTQSIEQLDKNNGHSLDAPGSSRVIGHSRVIGADRVLEHKDVLAESPYLESDSRRTDNMTPELQTQRLTAQLTAAYNRIAALEEQLLSQRIQ